MEALVFWLFMMVTYCRVFQVDVTEGLLSSILVSHDTISGSYGYAFPSVPAGLRHGLSTHLVQIHGIQSRHHQCALAYNGWAPAGRLVGKPSMVKSGGGVLFVSAAQFVVGLTLLGIYEGYKAYYFNVALSEDTKTTTAYTEFESPLDVRSPMGFSFYLAIINNVFAVCGLFGVLNAQRELIIGFFGYNAASMVISFHYFVDLCTDAGISYKEEPKKLTAYEQAAAAFIFFNFVLSVAATFFAVKAIDEIRAKQREDYNRIAVLSDTLQYEADNP